MARCSCAGGSCSCLIIQGNGIRVSGTGNASAPYEISLAPAPNELTLSADGPLDLSAISGYASVLVTLDANATSMVLPAAGPHVDLLIKQGVGGSHTIAWPASVLFPGGVDPVLTAPVNSIDWITLVGVGALWVGNKTAASLS